MRHVRLGPRRVHHLIALAGAVTLTIPALAPVVAAARMPHAEATAKRCRTGEVQRTISYVKRAGGRKYSAKLCVPKRARPLPTTTAAAIAGMVSRGRKTALELAPRRISRLARSKPARQLAGVWRIRDPLFARSFETATARAAKVTTTTDSTYAGAQQPGTITTAQRTGTERDGSEPTPGFEKEVIFETKSTRISSLAASDKERMKVSESFDRCPDANGVARGQVKWEHTQSRTLGKAGGGYGVIESTVTVETHLTAQFGDDARIATLESTGEWTWENQTRISSRRGAKETQVSRQSVSGTVGVADFGADSPDPTDTRHVRLDLEGVNATDSRMAVQGALWGLIMAGAFTAEVIKRAVKDLQGRIGGCLNLKPEPASVHVRPGQSVALGARLEDYAHLPRNGAITSTGGSAGGTVSPSPSMAAPVASFTYQALGSKPPGGTDTVVFHHKSKQGIANGSVTVIYDDPPPPDPPPPPPPTTYSGTISGTWVTQTTGEQWSFTGHATFNYSMPSSGPPQGGPPGDYHVYTFATGDADISFTATSPYDGCGFVGGGHLDLTGQSAGSLNVQDSDAPAYQGGFGGYPNTTIPATKTGSAPECDAGEEVDYPVPGVYLQMKSYQTSGSRTLVGEDDSSTPDTPFDYDVVTRWNLAPGSG